MKNKTINQQQAQKLAMETAAAAGMMTSYGSMVNSLLRATGR